ncbi:hypothetical protein MKI83_05245 [Pseudomonas sp. A3.4]|nr:hypothetical protein [Atopomonas sediminilitoris]MCJ8168672.1 hypothetical protein [Atopomonas sediminilitoris]
MPATLGEGCTRRFDPDALNEQSGTEFSGAAELWQALTGVTATSPAESYPPPALPQTPPNAR